MIHLLEDHDLSIWTKTFQMLYLHFCNKCFFRAIPEMNVNLWDRFQSVCIYRLITVKYRFGAPVWIDFSAFIQQDVEIV